MHPHTDWSDLQDQVVENGCGRSLEGGKGVSFRRYRNIYIDEYHETDLSAQ